MRIFHTPILVKEILDIFSLAPNNVVADLTTGEGGHSSVIAPLIPEGKLLCVDRDPEILYRAKERLKAYKNITYVCNTYDYLTTIRKDENFPLFDAILLDMGISMFHFKGAHRGFSFQDETFDMRLHPDQSLSAKEIVNFYDAQTLADIFYYYGEERRSRRIASEIVKARPFETASDFANFIARKMPKEGKVHPATKIFQSLRIYLNKELEIAEKFLAIVRENITINGVLGVITFHSLEDRLIKNTFLRYVQDGSGEILTKKPICPANGEINVNTSARSAKLRAFKKNV